jgi:hypothetical protein
MATVAKIGNMESRMLPLQSAFFEHQWLRLRHRLGVKQMNSLVTLEIRGIEGEKLLQAVTLHGSHQSRVMGAFAFHVVLRGEFPPDCENAPLVAEQSKEIKPELDRFVDIGRRHTEAVI